MTSLTRPLSSVLALLVLLSGGCAEPFDTPPAYESLRYLCDAENAAEWQELVATCRADYDRDKSCAGVVSFAGTLEEQRVVVESRLTDTSFHDTTRLDASVVRNEIATTGYSPYFQFRLVYKNVGGDVNLGESDRDLAFGVNPDATEDSLLDEYTTSTLRITNAGRSEDLSGLSGAVSFTMQLANEQAGSFVGAFGDTNDYIDGCFHLFATETVSSQEQTL